MDQYGSQGKGSGYKKYFQKYMQGSDGAGGYEHFMAVSLSQLGVKRWEGSPAGSTLLSMCCSSEMSKTSLSRPMTDEILLRLYIVRIHHGKIQFHMIWLVL